MPKQPFLMENRFIPRLVGEWFLKVAVWHWVKPAPKTSLWLLCSLADCCRCMLFAWVTQIRLANHWAAVKLEKVETGNGVCSPSKLCLSTFTLKVIFSFSALCHTLHSFTNAWWVVSNSLLNSSICSTHRIRKQAEKTKQTNKKNP